MEHFTIDWCKNLGNLSNNGWVISVQNLSYFRYMSKISNFHLTPYIQTLPQRRSPTPKQRPPSCARRRCITDRSGYDNGQQVDEKNHTACWSLAFLCTSIVNSRLKWAGQWHLIMCAAGGARLNMHAPAASTVDSILKWTGQWHMTICSQQSSGIKSIISIVPVWECFVNRSKCMGTFWSFSFSSILAVLQLKNG